MSFSELFPYLFGAAFVAIVAGVVYGLGVARRASVGYERLVSVGIPMETYHMPRPHIDPEFSTVPGNPIYDAQHTFQDN